MILAGKNIWVRKRCNKIEKPLTARRSAKTIRPICDRAFWTLCYPLPTNARCCCFLSNADSNFRYRWGTTLASVAVYFANKLIGFVHGLPPLQGRTGTYSWTDGLEPISCRLFPGNWILRRNGGAISDHYWEYSLDSWTHPQPPSVLPRYLGELT